MRKIIILILLSIFMLNIAYASDLNVYSVKFYTLGDAGERIKLSGVDEDGGDFKIKAGGTLIMEYKFENVNLSMNVKKLRLKSVIENIDDGADVKETSESFKVNADDMQTVEYTIIIPSNAERDDYDLTVDIIYQWDNLVQETLIYNYTMTVSNTAVGSVTQVSTGSTYVPMQDIVLNVSYQCGRYFGFMNEWQNNNLRILSDAKNLTYDAVLCESRKLSLDNINTQITYLQKQYDDLKVKDDSLFQNSTSCQTSLMMCNMEKNNMKTADQCKIEVNAAILANKPSSFLYLGWVLFILAVGYWKFSLEKKSKKYSPNDSDIVENM